MPHAASLKLKMWRASLLLAGGLFILLTFYTYFYNSGNLNLLAISQSIAGTAAIMIGLSFAMSAIGFYWDFLDAKVAYRKYLGLVGFWLALLYSIALLFVDTQKYFYNFFKNLNSADFILGLSAMAILSFMAIISNNWAMMKIGAKNWRRLLRLGYLAYALLVIRSISLEWGVWEHWLSELSGVPPPRLILSIFATVVILMRGSIFISRILRRNSQISQN